MNREQQLEIAVKFTKKWLEENGCIAVYQKHDGEGRHACVAQIYDRDAAFLDVMVEHALNGTLDEKTADDLSRAVEGFNFRDYLTQNGSSK